MRTPRKTQFHVQLNDRRRQIKILPAGGCVGSAVETSTLQLDCDDGRGNFRQLKTQLGV
jgi:hypothetical protein